MPQLKWASKAVAVQMLLPEKETLNWFSQNRIWKIHGPIETFAQPCWDCAYTLSGACVLAPEWCGGGLAGAA